MAISHPRRLVALDQITRCTWKPLHQQVRSPSRGGNPGIASLGRDLWQVEYQTRPLHEAEALAWKAWLASLRGGLRAFKAQDPLRRYLLAYRNGYGGLVRFGGGAFDGTAVVQAVSAQLDTVTIGTLPAGLAFAAGDHLSITYASGLQALHQVVEAATASGGGVAVLLIEPTLVPGLAAGAAVQLADPWCLAVLDPGAPVFTWLPGRRVDGVKFAATQVF